MKEKAKIRKSEKEGIMKASVPKMDPPPESNRKLRNSNKRNQNLASTSTTPVQTQNSYSPLNNDENLSDTDSRMETASQSNKRRRISTGQNDNDLPPKSTSSPPPTSF